MRFHLTNTETSELPIPRVLSAGLFRFAEIAVHGVEDLTCLVTQVKNVFIKAIFLRAFFASFRI